MKAVSLIIGLSLLSSVSFAKKITVAGGISSVSCHSIVDQDATQKVASSLDSAGVIQVAIAFVDEFKSKSIDLFTVDKVELETEESKGAMIISLSTSPKGTSSMRDAEIEIDNTGTSTISVNGSPQDILNLQCVAQLRK